MGLVRNIFLSIAVLAATVGLALSQTSVTTNPSVSGTGVNLSDGSVTGTLPATRGGTGVSNNAAATLTRSGSHALTLTTTGTTNVTFPTSGTLATAVPSYTSSGQTITSAGQLVLAHGLSSAPTLIQCRLKVVNGAGANGYSQNDEFILPCGAVSLSSIDNMGVSVVVDATNITVRYGSNTQALMILDKSNGTTAITTNSSFNLIIQAWVL